MQPNQWQQQYPYNGGFQPRQTGFQPGGPGGSLMSSQPTGFQQPMQTGFNQQRPPLNLSSAPTGMGGNMSFLNQPPQQSNFRPSGMTSQMTGYPGGGASGLMSQQTGFQGAMMSQPTGMGMAMGGGGLMSQPTGMGGLRPRPTGIHDPRLQSMMQSFMPSNLSQPFAASGAAQFNPTPQQQPLTQTFQSLLQNPSVKTPKVPWTLSRQEKKDYDQIFRAWDTDGDGFITGETAREVFGQAGLGQEGLMKIWNLSDVDNRGKLNLPEFHVAMGLIYRALNGNEIPDKLPEELVPASMRDIDITVNFMRDLLKHDASTSSNTSSPGHGTPIPAAESKDATMYKHDDTRSSGAYKPSGRHLDRKSVRYAGEDSSADIGDIRRQLQNTSALFDRTNEESMRKSAEDEELEQEVDDLKYKVKRIQEDMEYVSKGRRSGEKDEERRKLEREMLYLMHEKLPELERRQQQREDGRRMEERAGVRARDKRNDTHGRYGHDDRDDDPDWLRGTYDRDRDRNRDRDHDRRGSRDRSHDRDYDSYRDRSRERDRDRDHRPRSPPQVRSPPPAPPPASTSSVSAPPPAPPAPTSQAAAAPSTKNMTAEERTAFIREQAQRRIQDRLKALGVQSSSAEQPAVDKSVEERLEREKQEAEEKAKTAEREQEAREQARQARLAGTGSVKEEEKPKSPTPKNGGLKSALKKPGPAPAPPSSRLKQPPAPPTPRGAAVPPIPRAPPASTTPAEDREETEIRRKEKGIQKAKEERKKRLQELEQQEEEERKREEEMLAARKSRGTASEQITSPAAPSPSVAPPAPSDKGYNPFRKPNAGGATPSPAQAASGFNPFFKPPAAAQTPPSPAAETPPPPPRPPPPAQVPAPPPSASQARAAFSPPPQDDWEEIQDIEANESDSSDDEYANSRASRGALASALFGNVTSPPGSRPGSAAPTAPSAPKAPPAALQNLGGGDPTAGRGALLSAIQGGARLKKAATVDKSCPPVSGKVIGDTAPPAHINTAAPPSPPTPAADDSFAPSNSNRQSVDWYAGLAADQAHPAASHEAVLESTREEQEPKLNGFAPAINVSNENGEDLSEFDFSKSLRVRTLYAYDGQREVDLPFKENVVIVAHPAKDASSPWWYGMSVEEGRKGWFPHSYVEEMTVTRAKASYAYDGGSEEELPFTEGDVLDIVDTSDGHWWKTEKAGVIFIVPASYLEIIGSNPRSDSIIPPPPPLPPKQQPSPQPQRQIPVISTRSPQPRPKSLLSPSTATDTRSRSPSIKSADEGDESSDDDSVLSWWSSDESNEEVDEEKEAERKHREVERKRMLSSAGLQLRREPPGVPSRTADRKVSRRRPAPAAPKKRRQAPAVPSSSETDLHIVTPSPEPEEQEQDPRMETQDAYARYESFLAQSSARPTPLQIPSDRTSPAASPAPTRAAMSPAASVNSLGKEREKDPGSRLSGFFSRMMAPAVSQEKEMSSPTTRISGPITRVDTSVSQEESVAQEFGKTWSSLVDPGVLESMSGRERKRQEAIFEFIATESTYNRDLQLIVEVFYASLLNLLDEKAQTVIFANVEDILLANTSFLSSLEQRQKACRLYVDTVGDLLEDHMREMGVYTTYCVNQQQASRLLQSLRQVTPELAAHLQSIRESNSFVRGLDLSSFLLIPMQRITRYPLLVKQIIHYTEADQDLHALHNALNTVESIVRTINESVREAEGNDRLRVLCEDLWIGGEGRLDLTAPTQYQGPRRLLKEDQVMKAKSGRKLILVLCNDVLVLIESRNLYRMPIPLFDLSVRAGRDDSSFVLKVDYHRGGDTVGLKATSAREAKEWIARIDRARIESIDARKGTFA